MKDLVEYIIKNLVTNPAAVIISEDSQDGQVNLNLTVAPEDMGIVIGKSGQTIKAIRKILTVRAIADNVRVNLQLTEVDRGETAQPQSIEEQATEEAENKEETENKEEK